MADSIYAVSQSLRPYSKYIKGRLLNNIELAIISKKKSDGLYHLRHLENKLYKPKNKYHFSGDGYILTNGPTFSAAALFCNAMKGQDRILLVGEETGEAGMGIMV